MIRRAPEVLEAHRITRNQFSRELSARLDGAPSREVLLFVHGFNETFESAAYTSAELCHFLGREDVCAFFT